jgi:hypothetical protein
MKGFASKFNHEGWEFLRMKPANWRVVPRAKGLSPTIFLPRSDFGWRVP